MIYLIFNAVFQNRAITTSILLSNKVLTHFTPFDQGSIRTKTYNVS